MNVFADDFAADVVLDSFGDGLSVAPDALGHAVDGLRDAGFNDEFEERHVIEGRDFERLVGFDWL